MKKKLLLVCMALLSLFGANSAPVMPTISTASSYTYYTLTFARVPTKCFQDNGIDALVTQVTLPSPISSATSAQKWRIEETSAGATSYYLVSKLGTRIYYNGSRCVTNLTGHTYNLVATTNTSYVDKWEFARVGGLVINDRGTADATEYNANDGGNPIIFNFVETVTPDITDIKAPLLATIAVANILKTAAVIGTLPGQYLQTSYDIFVSAIGSAQDVYDNSVDAAVVESATSSLTTAISTFKSTVIFPFTLSSAASPVWYYIAGAAATGYSSLDKVIGVNTVSMKNYWSASVGSAAQMFRFEQVPNTTTFKIINMFYPNGGLVATASPILCSTSSAAAWSFEKLTGASGDQYRITSGGRMMHLAQNNSEVVDYGAGYNSASCLKFVAVDPTVASNAILNYLQTSIDLHQGLYNNSALGTAPGQYLAPDLAAFNTALTTANDVKTNLATKTPAEVLTVVTNMATANTTLITTAIMPTSSLSSTPVWYRIKSACLASALPALSGKFMTTSVADTTVTLQTAANSDYQLWRVEKQVSGSYYLVNKGTAKFVQIGRSGATGGSIWFGCNGSTGLEFVVQAMGEGRFTFTKKTKKDAWEMIYANATVGAWLDNANYQSRWAIEPIVALTQTITFADITAKQLGDADFSLGATTDATGVTLTYASSNEGIATVSAAGLVHITATAAGTTNITVTQSGNIFYNAATPVMKVLTVGEPNGLKSVDAQVTVTAKNRMLVITGTTEKAQAFTATGAQVDATKALNAGIYIVKVAGKTLKVNVQ